MSLDFTLKTDEGDELFSSNITHNLTGMASAAGIYKVLWRPDENGYATAQDCIKDLSAGLIELLTNRVKYEAMNSPNGWGLYAHFVPFVQEILVACSEYPKAIVEVSR